MYYIHKTGNTSLILRCQAWIDIGADYGTIYFGIIYPEDTSPLPSPIEESTSITVTSTISTELKGTLDLTGLSLVDGDRYEVFVRFDSTGYVGATHVRNIHISIETEIEKYQEFKTTEFNTGRVWIDGKTIYRKVISSLNVPNNSSASTAHGITNIDTVISVEGMIYNSYYIPMSLSHASARVGLSMDNTNIIIESPSNYSTYSAFVIVEYTKTV